MYNSLPESGQLHPAETDIDVLPGIGHKVRWYLRQAGIKTVADVCACSLEALDEVPGIGRVLANRLKTYARAVLDQRAIWLALLPESCQRSGLMFDLETDPASATPWSLGWSTLDGRLWNAVVAPDHPAATLTLPDGSSVILVPSQETAWDVFTASAAPGNEPIYHWTGYDAGIMRRFAPATVKTVLDSRMHDLHATFKRTVALPQRSTSLKPVARYLGFAWPEGAEGGQGWWLAWQDYQHWLKYGDEAALARSCRYQRADVEALAVVWQWLNDRPTVE